MEESNNKPIPSALTQPILIAGAQREPVIMLWTVVFMFLFGMRWTVFSLVVTFLLATVGHVSLVLLAKYDPEYFQILRRHLSHRDYYSAAAEPDAEHLKIQPSVPRKGRR